MAESWVSTVGIALDHEADVPLGVQLDWVVRAAVASGRLRAGDRLPGLREVADQLGVNHNTVRAAVAKLEADGLLETRHGSGTFVAPGAATQLRHAALLDEVARRAQDAGVSARELAAALYVTQPEAASPARDAEGAERRRLREDLAVLDRVLCELERRLSMPVPHERGTPRAAGPRVLNADELRVQRDALVRRLVQVQQLLDEEAAPATAPRTAPAPARVRRAPRPGTAPA